VADQLVLIDGSSYFFRAFYAIRGISNSKGLPTNAAYGFTAMLVKMMETFPEARLGVVFDAAAKTFRNELYPKYKANRQAMPEDLSVQIPYIKRIPPAYRLATLEQVGWEADDIIGTLSHQAYGRGYEVIIVTADKDFMQLVTKSEKAKGKAGIVLYDDRDDRTIGVERVRERFGVEPEQVIDVLAIMGDSSDNVPGVRGIGPKGATALVSKFGSVPQIYRSLQQIDNERTRRLLEEGRPSAELCRRLVTISREAPVRFDPEAFARREPDKAKLTELFRELEFKRFLTQVAPEAELPKQTAIRYEKYRCVTQAAELRKIVKELKKAARLSIDTETDALDPMRANLVGISMAAAPGEAIYIPVGHRYLGAPPQIPLEEVRAILGPLLASAKPPKVGQNLKFDRVVLQRHGLPVEGAAFDTMLASYLIDPEAVSHSLDAMAKQYLHHDTIPFEEVVGKGKKQITFDMVNVALATEYSGEDADAALRLEPILAERLDRDGLRGLMDDVEMPLMRILATMEMNGVAIDAAALEAMSREFGAQLRAMKAEAQKLAGAEFNLDSPKQLQEILFTRLKLPPQKQTQTGYSTDASVLEKLAASHPLPAKILEYRSLAKLKSTYADALPKLVHPHTGRIHTSYNQAIAATGRLSSSDPNLQNIPVRQEVGRRIRRAFVAPRGALLVSADYSQVELRVLAHMADDADLIGLFQEGADIHAATASELFGVKPAGVSAEMRRKAKEVNFGIVYGLTAYGLSERIGVPVGQAKQFIERTFARFGGVRAFLDKLLEGARQTGFVSTILGRRRYIRDINSRNGMLRQAAERMAINAPVQGSAADLMKLAMIRVAPRLEPLEAKMILQVHDELVVECARKAAPKVKQVLREEMEAAARLKVPLVVDLAEGTNWGDLE
jgi:DNA polymerase-1